MKYIYECPHCKKESMLVITVRNAKQVKKKKLQYSSQACISLVREFWVAKGLGDTQVAKNQNLWGRQMIDADRLLKELGGRVDLAIECIWDRSKSWTFADWTLSGVARGAKLWLAEKQK